MIIGVNGKINSGKDTVGKIIQFLVANKNLPKDMQYVSIEELDSVVDVYSNWHIKKFAGKLKQTASLLTGIPVENFEDQEFKKQYMPEEWAVEIWNDPDPIEGNDYRITSRIKYEDDTSLITYNDGLSEAEVFDHEIEKRLMTYREFLQKLGTEAMRDGLHTNVWVNALFADYKELSVLRDAQGIKIFNEKGEHQFNYPNWILTDMRFPNELEAVIEKGGITIRVVREIESKDDSVIAYSLALTAKAMRDKTGPFHPSETALDEHTMHYEIINDGSIEDLIEKVRQILITEKII